MSLPPATLSTQLLEPIAPGGPDIEAQALYARTHECARTEEDVLRRRTTVALRGKAMPHAEARVRALLKLPQETSQSRTA